MDVRVLAAEWQGVDSTATELLLVVLPVETAQWQIPDALAAVVREAVDRGDVSLKAGKTLCLLRPAGLKAQRLVAVVAGQGSKALASALQAGAAEARATGARQWTLLHGGREESLTAGDWAELGVRSIDDGAYVYTHTKPSAESVPELKRLNIVVGPDEVAAGRAGVARGRALAAGVRLARECANRPANHCTPSHLAEVARSLGKDHGVAVEVLDRKAVEKLGMGAFLAVAQGAVEPLKFIVLRYEGAARKEAPVVLVGKGITFDTGGISIKPAAGMDEMKFDMGGAASVLGTFRAVAELKPRVNLVGLIPACENMPSGNATRPGDVVTSLSGQTIEILNTDAEGRLILCDALTYAARFKPAVVVDIATLTGACVVALGHQHSGLFCADEGLATELLDAGARGLDTAWRMPMDDEYAAGLKSNFADVANVGPREGGAITAAMFLQRFAKAYPWAHLDIAGTAWKSGGAKGATGRPVPLLTNFVLGRAVSSAEAEAASDKPQITARKTVARKAVPARKAGAAAKAPSVRRTARA